MRRALLLAWPTILALPGSAADFSQEIEPIFRENCYACHGEQFQQGQLRLDSRSVAFARGPSGPRIVARNPEESSLYQRVAGLGDGARMPMGGELAPGEIAAIREWIEGGAPWPASPGDGEGLSEHWAFAAPRRPEPPATRRQAGNPIDSFVLARLEAEGLAPSPQAQRATLARRLSLDITGLPPTLSDIERLVSDERPGAVQRFAERLLASPHFGERWGRVWLDAARYADSDGFEKDKPRQVWFYRDWVVRAMNADVPYDRFVVEQIAGDLLQGATQDQRVATGFLRNSMINAEGGANPEQFRMEAMFDRMDAIGKAVLGLTVQCAQCHDHKFDPLSQRDYYRLFAFINNAHESTQAVYTPEEEIRRREIFAAVDEIESGLRERMPDWRERMAAWEASEAGSQPEWLVLDATIELGSGEKYKVQPDGSILAQGYAPTRSVVTPQAMLQPGTVTAFRLELLTDPRLPLGGPGRSFRGTAALTEFSVEVAPADTPEKERKWRALPIASATADVNPPFSWLDSFLFPDKDGKRRILGDVDFAIDGFEMSAWNIDGGPGRRNRRRQAVFRLTEPLRSDAPTLVRFNLAMQHGGYNSDDNQSLNLGRYRLSATDSENAEADPLSARVRALVDGASQERTPDQQAAVFSHWRKTVEEWAAENRQIEDLWAGHPEGTSQLMLEERNQPRMTSILQRGDFLRPRDAVQSGVPGFLHALEATNATPPRLSFARWLVSDRSPTTARAIVNRIWQGYFGTGLVETPEDLGRQAPDPSHPNLLDWLAVELVESGWSLKHVHRLIVSSQTYQQSSRLTPELLERDPRNRLLARAARYRVDGEIVRDIALASSGLLTRQVGGAPMYPPAPDFLFQPPVSYGPKRWYEAEGADRYRRSLYAFRYRSVPFPVLTTFDTPTGNFACVKRDRSNTPLQALVTLNETVFVESARGLARRTLAEGGRSDAERVDFAFRTVLSRPPGDAERSELVALLNAQRGRLGAAELDAELLAFGAASQESPASGGPAREIAAWTAVSRVLLNLDETITRE